MFCFFSGDASDCSGAVVGVDCLLGISVGRSHSETFAINLTLPPLFSSLILLIFSFSLPIQRHAFRVNLIEFPSSC